MGCCQSKDDRSESDDSNKIANACKRKSPKKKDVTNEAADCEKTGMKVRRVGKLIAEDKDKENHIDNQSEYGRTALVTSEFEESREIADVQFDSQYDAHQISRRKTKKKSKTKGKKQNKKSKSKAKDK